MSCPWAKIEKPEPVNLNDIISEEVARDLQAKEEKKLLESATTVGENNKAIGKGDVEIPDDVLKALSDENFESDETIAQMLQMQFDKEYDDELRRKEDKFNGASKVSISFDNYRRAPLNFDFESESEEEEVVDIRDRKDWDRFDSLIENLHQYHKFQTGDGENFDLKLSNKVFNSLKTHAKHEQARRHKIHDKKEDQATAVFGVDEFTRLILYKMVNNQLLERVNGVISIGKEAVILHADSDPSFPLATEELPKECVIKVFKTTLSEFKQRDKYIKDDHRFKDRIGKQTARKTVHIWAEKEMANLMRLQRAGIPCPQVVTLKKHVLVMSFIGEDHRPAPKLKDARMKEVDYIIAYDEVIEEYNILWHNKQCYFIDVSQSVEPSHENAFHFLYRDCQNVINFFSKKGVPGVHTPDELFKYITSCDFDDTVALLDLKDSFKLKPHLIDKPGLQLVYNFDTAWEKVKSGEIPTIEKVIPEIDVNLIEPPKA
ncbi:hypothetical protein JTB14_013675 [Gonioctena quinquepunctata]|nr:hypothetical protein JTB14_013675 [Gonioctena quinquepunctata]